MAEYTAAREGMESLERKEWDTAISKLTTALKTTQSPKWLVARSKAYIGKGDFARALRDAEFAHAAAASRGNRAQIQEAQHRRAVAYLRLGRLADADACAAWVQRMVEGRNMSDPANREPEGVDERGYKTTTRDQLAHEMKRAEEARSQDSRAGALDAQQRSPAPWNSACALRLQILSQLDKLPADDERRQVRIKFAPDVSLKDFAAGEDKEGAAAATAAAAKESEEISAAAAESVRKQPEPSKDVRVDFFQSTTTMSVSIFVKNIPKDEFQIQYDGTEMKLSHIPGHEPWYTISLWGPVIPSDCKHTVTPNKVEIQLKKAEPGKWPTLRRDSSAPSSAPAKAPTNPTASEKAAPEAQSTTPAAATTAATTAAAAASSTAPAAPAAPKPSGPAYPTSSKSGPKDWDHIEGADEDEDSDINLFFKKLYKGASPEQQRAMMKSFTESNGTSLSTDWDDVKGRKVETVPPEGVEAKKWES